jgi:hypothetical protein
MHVINTQLDSFVRLITPDSPAKSIGQPPFWCLQGIIGFGHRSPISQSVRSGSSAPSTISSRLRSWFELPHLLPDLSVVLRLRKLRDNLLLHLSQRIKSLFVLLMSHNALLGK